MRMRREDGNEGCRGVREGEGEDQRDERVEGEGRKQK